MSLSGAPATPPCGSAISALAIICTRARSSHSMSTAARSKGHFQYHPNDSWDWDEVSPPIVVDYTRDGRPVKGLINVARNGYLYHLERTAGKINFVAGQPYVKQNVFKSLDPKTGRPVIDESKKPGTGKTAEFCPSL